MARCLKCNKFMLLPSRSGYCDDCVALFENENLIKQESQKLLNLSEEEWNSIFATKAREWLGKAQLRFDQCSYDEELLELLQHVLILADEETTEWRKAFELYNRTKQIIIEKIERERKEEEELIKRDKERRESNLKNNIHVGFIEADGFWSRKRGKGVRDYTFIKLIDGYNPLMYWYWDSRRGMFCHIPENEYDNENAAEEVFFHAHDRGKGSIVDKIDQMMLPRNLRHEHSDICVVFSAVSSKKGWKAIDVISIEDAISQKDKLECIKKLVAKDINVYFFLMNRKPELFNKHFSKITHEKIWKYTIINEDDVELTGINIEPPKREYDDYDEYDDEEDIPAQYIFPSETIFLPFSIDGKSVRKIASAAFAHIGVVKKFIIPDTVTEIDAGAFEDCMALEEVVMSKNIKKIQARAFANCVYLKKIELPDQLLEIGEMAFAGTRLEEITIPASVKCIDDSAFLNCNAIIKHRLK